MIASSESIRILFIGAAESSHSHSWITLVDSDPRFEIRLFGLPDGGPAPQCPVPVYNTCPVVPSRRGDWSLFPCVTRQAGMLLRIARPQWVQRMATRWLNRVIRSWRPHLVHTFGMDPTAELYLPVHLLLPERVRPRWVAQMRGGSDVAFRRYQSQAVDVMKQVMMTCDAVLTDNYLNLELMQQWGVPASKLPAFRTVPGTGGIEVPSNGHLPRSCGQRRLIIWPKAYECAWSKSLPVLNALTHAWDRLGPCQIRMLAADAETRNWLSTLPGRVRQNIEVSTRIPRQAVLELMGQARVMLAPSLVDGTPNTIFEAMAGGAVPIVSPLETIKPIVRDPDNVLFARNLYPDEIASALVRAMNDDELVDGIAQRNLDHVRRLADRAAIQHNIRALYAGLVRGTPADQISMKLDA